MGLGRFIVVDSLKAETPVKELLAGMQILRERPDFAVGHATEFLAEFEEFEPVAEGQLIPQYEFIFTRHDDGSLTRETRKV